MRHRLLTACLTLTALLMLIACATITPPEPPSLELPTPPSDLRATRKGDRVTLTWTVPTLTTDRQTIRNLGTTRICRGLVLKLEKCVSPMGEARTEQKPVADKSAKTNLRASYVDVLPAQLESDSPSAFGTYAVEVLNRNGRNAGLSNQVRVSLVHTLTPPQDFRAQVTDAGIVLSWTEIPLPHVPQPGLRYLYRIYRSEEGSREQVMVGEAPADDGRRDMSLTDPSIDWEKTYQYHADTVTVVDETGKPEVRIEGDDTPELKVFAHDVFPPAVPSGLQAVFSGPGQVPFVDLVWAPVTDVDLEGYNVYRREEGGSAAKLNAQPLKTPAYRDTNIASGKQYLYSVSAIDVRRNESARSEEASEAVP